MARFRKISLVVAIVLQVCICVAACSKTEDRTESLLSQARKNYDKGYYAMAQTFVREILDQEKENPEALYLLGVIAMKQNDKQMAATALSQVLQSDPDHHDAGLALAELLLSNRQYDQARSYIEHLLAIDPDDLDALILKSRLLIAQKQPEPAVALLDGLKKNDAKSAKIFELLALAKLQQKDSSGAEQALQEGLTANPEDISLRLTRASLYNQTERQEEAVSELERVIELAPDALSYPIMLADLVWKSGNSDKADGVLLKLIADKPESVERRLRVADFYLEHKQFKKAGKILEEAIDDISENTRLSLALSRYYQLMGQTEKSVETLLTSLSRESKPEGRDLKAVQLALAQNYFQRRDVDHASEYIERVLSADPDDLDAVFLKGRIAMAQGRFDQAISAFNAVLAGRPDLLQAYLQLAQAHLLAGSTDPAVAVLQQGVKRMPASKPMHQALARACLARKDYKGAEAELLKVLKIDPSDHKVQAELGDFYAQLKDFRQAEREYAEIVSKYPDKAIGYIKLAGLYERQQLPAKAIAELVRGYERNGQSKKLLVILVSAYLNADNPEAAVKLCKKRIAENDKDAFSYNLLGKIYVHLKQYKKAEPLYRQAMDLAPQWSEPDNNIAALMLKTDRKGAAIRILETSLEKKSGNAAAYLTLARFAEEDSDFKKAINYYERGLKAVPEFGDAAHRLSVLLCHTDAKGETLDKALHLALQAYQLKPGRADIVDTLGWIYHLRGNDTRSVQLLRRVLEQMPDNPSANYHLAMVVLDEGKKEEARQFLETALKRKNSFFVGRPEAEKVLNSIKKAG